MHASVQEYYGRILSSSADLKTSACCTVDSVPEQIKPMIARVHPDIRARYYGCGLLAPQALEGARVLDLGCGTGMDCYVLAQLVGEHGEVVGVDMTPAQLELAREHQEYHRQSFGHARSNVRFLDGYIEALDALDLDAGSFDVIVSNCVVNLSPDKPSVFAQARRLLADGGEFYFSDVYADRRVPTAAREDQELWGECLAGALYWNDFLAMARRAGFLDPRLVTSRELEITDPTIAARLDGIRFYSATYRLFALPDLEPTCEDYGEAVRYLGTVAGSEGAFQLDRDHVIATGRIFPVCGNTREMLARTRFADHFDFYGSTDRHFGPFPGCRAPTPEVAPAVEVAEASCC
ncbi:MAG: methyltransferase domain-containing protein [Pseudomonadota bacterium]